MTVNDIIISVGRQLNQVAVVDNKEVFRDSLVTQKGLLDELNRLYLYVICQHIMAKTPDEFTVEARKELYLDKFTVVSGDNSNNYITVSENIFSTANVGMTLVNTSKMIQTKIIAVINSNIIQIDTELTTSTIIDNNENNLVDYENNYLIYSDVSEWAGDTIYMFGGIIKIDQEALDAKDIVQVKIKYTETGLWYDAEYTTVPHFMDRIDNFNKNTQYNPHYAITSIQNDQKMQRILKINPIGESIKGEVRMHYVQLPYELQLTDTPRFKNYGISEILINGLIAWSKKMLNEYNEAQAFEENNSTLGGIVPKGTTRFMDKFRLQRDKPITFRSVWR